MRDLIPRDCYRRLLCYGFDRFLSNTLGFRIQVERPHILVQTRLQFLAVNCPSRASIFSIRQIAPTTRDAFFKKRYNPMRQTTKLNSAREWE